MAASLITKIPPYIFPFQVDRLEIQTQANADCKVMLEVDYLPILSAHLTAGHNGVVTLDDLQPLVSEAAEACGAMPVHFSVFGRRSRTWYGQHTALSPSVRPEC